MRRFDRALTPKEIAALDDKDIDFGDIPELDRAFWNKAKLVDPDKTVQVTLRVKRSVLEFFRAGGKGYQTRINQVLETYAKARREQ